MLKGDVPSPYVALRRCTTPRCAARAARPLRAPREIPESQRYYELKKGLSAKFGSDRDGYTDAKTSFIESVVTKARASEATDSHKGLKT